MKFLLWCMVVVGLLPCVLLALAGLAYWRQAAKRDSFGSSDVLVHDEYFQIGTGSWSCQLYPRLWAFALLALGVMALVVALVALLHVPKNSGAG